jgi:hypothetical protein
MPKHPQWLLVLGSFLFAVGVLVGQQAQRSRFDKYLRAVNVSQMQIAVLETNMGVLRTFLPFEVPKVYYDPSCSCVGAQATITSDETKKPFDELRAHLNALVETTLSQILSEVPEAKEHFQMTFTELNFEHLNPPRTIAEYANGKLTFK